MIIGKYTLYIYASTLEGFILISKKQSILILTTINQFNGRSCSGSAVKFKCFINV